MVCVCVERGRVIGGGFGRLLCKKHFAEEKVFMKLNCAKCDLPIGDRRNGTLALNEVFHLACLVRYASGEERKRDAN